MARSVKKYGRAPRYKKPLVAAKFSKTKRDALVKKMRQVAKATMNRNIETKKFVRTATDGVEIFHNNFITLSSAPFETQQGTADGETPGVNGVRIGDEVMARGYSMKFMVELNERYSDVTFRLLMVKCAKGDTPTRATLFHGQSGNKMIDSINTERYTIVHQKWFKIKAPNLGLRDITTQLGPALEPSGIYTSGAAATDNYLSRATKIVKFWVPASKFTRNGILRYQNASTQVKFFDYHVLLYAYSNYSTAQDLYFVARLNDTVEQFYFKDA
jgi:hypothetical protein